MCLYIHILSLCCVLHLLIFLKCSLAFVILPVSTLLFFIPCFQKRALPFVTPHREKTHWSSACPSLAGGTPPTSYHRSFNKLFITIFLFIIPFVFCFIYIGNFYLDQYSAHEVTAKSELCFCLFVILLVLLRQLISIRNEDLQTNPDYINYISTRLWLQADNHHTIVWSNHLSVPICRTSTRG